jgi:hypothetical protein
MDTSEHLDAGRDEEPADALEYNPILERLERIEGRLDSLHHLLLILAITTAAFMIMSCLAVTAVKGFFGGHRDEPFGGGVPGVAVSGAPRSDVPGLVDPAGEPPGTPVTDTTALAGGAEVLVEAGGQWWRADVLDVLDDGHVLVRYFGWGEEHDEEVARDRLRQPK